MHIKDLVNIDEHGALRSDVQLSDYDDPTLNRDLLRNYIFTVSAPSTSGAGRDMSAKDVLDALKTAFTLDRVENRMVLTANYGRGKSHLALTLANFFARPADSEEVSIIFERLGQALNNAATVRGYQDFKQSKGEFLVIRLRGDGFDDLQDGFLRALEQALSEHERTRDVKLPFWHEHAREWLDKLSGDSRQKAEAFLADHRTDLKTLRQDLRKQGAYELVQETFKHVTGLYADFGREVSLKDLVLWAVDEVCKPNKMGGLLILFDEFSLFLQKYAGSRAAGKLQELLNGVSDRQGKSAFLAFTQSAPESVLEGYAQGSRRDDVKKELDRLPQDKRARLFSLMEGVIDSYLKQDEKAWQAWQQRPPVRSGLARNREMLYKYFGQRYSEDLRWDLQKTEQTVVKGCFPLHPLTTAILSNHTFDAGAGENPRTALHFIRDRWDKGLPDQPAEREDGSPNFIFAIELVDFFGAQISKKWHAAYRAALENSRVTLEDEDRAALKALLLQQAVSALDKNKPAGSAQLELLSALSGLPQDRLKEILRKLSDNRVIQFDPYQKVSSLLPVGVRSPEADAILEQAVQKVPIDRALLDEIAEDIPTLTVPLQFGNAEDWAPRQVLLTAELFTPETLKTLLSPYRAKQDGIEESPRGWIVWLLAQTEEEKMRLRQNARGVLDKAIGANNCPLPVVIVLPDRLHGGLLQAARRRKALKNLSNAEREKIGTIGYQNEMDQAQRNFLVNFAYFIDREHYADLPRQPHDLVVPGSYLSAVQVLKNHSLKSVLEECYKQAYTYRVEFSDKPVGGKGINHLRTAVQHVTGWLFRDTAGQSIDNLTSKDMQYMVARHYLTDKWGLLSHDGYAIQPPTSLKLRAAWNRLEATFPPGCKETRADGVLLELLNPPYGHDYNTLMLLLAAWIGYHRHEISLSLGGKRVSRDQLIERFVEAKSPKQFLERLIVSAPLAISHIDSREAFAEADAILDQVRRNQPFSLPEAEGALAKLQQTQDHPALSPDRREAIAALMPRLREAAEQARKYDEGASGWRNEISNADFNQLLKLRHDLEELAPPTLVLVSQPDKATLLKEWESHLGRETESYCRLYADLKDLSEYKAHEERLNRALRALREYPGLYAIAERACQALSQRRDELKQAESERPIIAEINIMATSAGLADLYKYRDRLAQLGELSARTEQLRREKAQEVESRIQQFEQLAHTLAQEIEQASSLEMMRRLENSLSRRIEQTKGTLLHATLKELADKISQLMGFFERLQKTDKLPQLSPQDLNIIEAEFADLEEQFSARLSPAQAGLLRDKQQQLVSFRQQKAQEANRWLAELERRHQTKAAPPDALLREAQAAHAFLSREDAPRLEQLKQALQHEIDADRVLKIESLFKELDAEARRACLRRLQALIETP